MDNAIQVETADTPSKGYRVFKVFRTIFIYLLFGEDSSRMLHKKLHNLIFDHGKLYILITFLK